jgi:hypothetical protein
MNKLTLLACIIFLGVSSAYAHLGHEREFWLDEIEKTERLASYPSTTGLGKYLNHGSKEEKHKTVETIAEVIKSNPKKLLIMNMNTNNPHDADYRVYLTNNILDALIYNHTIENLYLGKLIAPSSEQIAKILKTNKTIKRIGLDDADFDNDGAIAIAEALKQNNTLLEFSMENNKFSMASRNAIKKAWSSNQVANRVKEIQF